MTCSGCGNKLQRSLESLPGVNNVSVNFIMKRADFEIDPSLTNAANTITKAQQMTGFSLSKISNTDHHLEFLTTAASARILAAKTLPGVTSITPLKSSVLIAYNPTHTGARTLATSIGNLTTGLAPPPTTTDPATSTHRATFRALTLKTLAAATLTIPIATLAWSPHLAPPRTRNPISLALATFVQAIAVHEFYAPALRSLARRRALEMDALVAVSVSAAYAYSVVAFACGAAGRPLATEPFFETGALLVALVLLGRLVGAWARVRAVAAVSVRGGQAGVAVVVEGGVGREVDARLLQYGDVFRVAPHTKVPTDGAVVGGVSEVDESMVTGETLPVAKGPGSAVVAGTVNGEGALTVRLGRLPGSNTVTDIAELVEDALKTKPRVQEIADRVAGWFVWVVVGVAAVVLCVWVAVALRVGNESGAKVADTALSYCIAVLAVSCPCALGLAVPMVLVIAGGVAARGGVVIKSAQSVERARKITDVVFDKTGTLTMQELSVVTEEGLAEDHFESASLARALVSGNNHPVSAAVAKHLETQDLDPPDLENSRVIPGSGITAVWNGFEIRAGNARWTRSEDHPTVRRLTSEGMTVLCVTKAGELAVVYGLKSVLRPEAVAVVDKLRGKNIAVHLVSGDERKAVEAVRAAVGIPPGNTVSRQTPAEKRVYVRQLMDDGKVTLFCGDGTNDAVAIAQADVGVQVGSSSDVSRATADVILLSGLEGIMFLLDVSAASFHRIVFNFVWSAVYNVFAILLAAGAFVKVRIPPAYAGLGELVSVLPVIFAAFTMSRMKR
ncbi:ATPase P-type K/Mg/Cd/Cu/Zn/Na/Ca/Na/H-transporter [Neofusicoccum parvum]|uniref:ATPase P-type K/Mg/Cd/Cu/Zn/Na/Ca/Na/H-transporter n=1 Tax=Neofusicoccum parvum TaxID=310453 RepID=A0ACB5SMK5_9PEZI|nr:ATPase P-type K/Mg/Cd/Cu/Zn/Na/Ca/Na/H-transporter [Neofusicoccum parvum]